MNMQLKTLVAMMQKSQFLLLMTLCLILFFTGLGNYGLLAKDEPRYAQCALEMIQNHDWVVPMFNYEYRFDKPPLFYWTIAIAYKLLGVSEFAARLPSVLSAILLVFITWYMGKRFIGGSAGFLSAIILVSSSEYVFLGRRASTDMILCFFFTLSLYFLFIALSEKLPTKKLLLSVIAGIFTGLAILTKGPVALVVPLAICFIYLLISKTLSKRNIIVLASNALVGLIISLPWFLAIHFITNGDFTRVFFLEHNIGRFTSVIDEHSGPIWFYIPILLGGLMPWTLFVLPGIFSSIKESLRKERNNYVLFCLIWASFVFVFFSFSSTKLATYILLTFPPLALITGHWISTLEKKGSPVIQRLMLLLALLLAIIGTLTYNYIAKSKLEIVSKLALQSGVVVFLTVFIVGFALAWTFKEKHRSLVAYFALCLAIPSAYILNIFFPTYYQHTYNDLKEMAVITRNKKIKEVVYFGHFQPLLVFYSGAHIDFNRKKDKLKKIKELLQTEQKVYVIVPTKAIQRNGPFVQKYKRLFDSIEIVNQNKKYILGSIPAKTKTQLGI